MHQKESLFLIDESHKENYSAVCVVCVQGKDDLKLLMDQLRQISIVPTVRAYNSSGVFHYCDDSIGARQSIVSWITKMPISVYMSITQTNTEHLKENKDMFVYQCLLPEILKPLQMKYRNRFDSAKISLRFENLSKNTKNDLIFFQKSLSNALGYEDMEISIATKENEPLIFLPDYFLGFVRDQLTNKDPKISWPKDALKLISSKIGLIHICDTEGTKRYQRGEEIKNLLC